MHLNLKSYPAVLLLSLFVCTAAYAEMPADGWSITVAGEDCRDSYSGVSVANGTLGLLPWKEPFSVRHLMLNNVFEKQGKDRLLTAQKGICPFGVTMTVDGAPVTSGNVSEWSQTLDMKNARHVTSFVSQGKVRVEYSFMALRNLPFCLMMTCSITALDDAEVAVSNRMSVPDNFIGGDSRHDTFYAESRKIDLIQTSAGTEFGAHSVHAASMFFPDSSFRCSPGGISARIGKGKTACFSLAASVCSTADFNDPLNESVRQIVYIDRMTPEKIISGHHSCWEELWKGDIEIEGDDEAQRVVRLALYSLYSSCRAGSRLSIPPMGLSSAGYSGHIFWDSELWMFPPLLLLNQGIAASMIDYRADRLEAARRKAFAYGYDGAMFPWESDGAGEESTPVWAITGPMEHHVSADVAIAAWNYYCVTRDRNWLAETGWPLMRGVAEFWESRAVRNPDGSWSIAGVTGADEYANNVTDNAFTNGAVIRALQCAIKAGRLCKAEIPRIWKDIADGLRILVSPDGITLEYEGYGGAQIKQADVNLLGYPLGIVTDRDRLLRDLEYYEDKIDPVNGPAMSFSIFCVQYARLGDAVMAEEMFRRCYRPFLRPPFGVFSETASSDNPYFVTGAGGLLQAVMNGFGGLEITDRGIVRRKSVLPASWKRLTIKGVGPQRQTFVIERD